MKVINIKKEDRRGFVYVSMPDVLPPLVTVGA
jgi:hypothetical protein